jgi:hypothetical protein
MPVRGDRITKKGVIKCSGGRGMFAEVNSSMTNREKIKKG